MLQFKEINYFCKHASVLVNDVNDTNLEHKKSSKIKFGFIFFINFRNIKQDVRVD